MPVASACAITNFEASKPSVIGMLVTDVTLLLVMLSGLLRLRRSDGGSSKLGRFLWKQVGGGDSRFRDIIDPLIHLTYLRVLFGSLLPLLQ
jgi:hypothetical protein